jgi:hypothetical protein
VEAEEHFDGLQFVLDVNIMTRVESTVTTWAERTIQIPKGSHTLKWEFLKVLQPH